VLTSDGLLKDPDSKGSYYEETNVNDKAPFESEVDAIVAAKDYYEDQGWGCGDYVLHCEYAFRTED